MSNITIIGSGIAAKSLSERLLKMGFKGKITVYTKDKVPYSRMAILNVLKQDIEKDSINLNFPEEVEIYTEREVVKINADSKTIIFKDNQTARYVKLVIATGATPKRLQFENAEIPVLTIRDIEDVEKIDMLIKEGKKKAVLLGGGFINMEMANALYKRGVDTTILVSSSRILSRMLPHKASEIVERELVKRGIKVIKNATVKDIKGSVLHLHNGHTIKADFVVIGKGVKRSLIPVIWRDKEYSDYNADEYFKTPFPDIFLIGDALMTKDLISGKLRHNAIWPIAEKEGRYLADTLFLKDKKPYKGDVAYNMLSVFDTFIFVIGDITGENIRVNLETEKSLYMVSEIAGKITGIVAINHPLPFARIVKNFMRHGYY